MVKSIVISICFVLFLSSNIIFVGCSLIGFGIGAAVDPAETKSVRIPAALRHVKQGTNLVVYKKDGSVIEGAFVAATNVPDTIPREKYREEYERWQLQTPLDSVRMPAFASKVLVRVRIPQGRDPYAGSFAGFDSGKIRIEVPPWGESVRIRMEYVTEVCDSAGNSIATRESIVRALDQGMPLADRVHDVPGITLTVNNQGGLPIYVRIPIEDIEAADMTSGGTGKWVGLGVGAALDVLWIVAASAAAEGCQQESCQAKGCTTTSNPG